jgi:hypothetical protein
MSIDQQRQTLAVVQGHADQAGGALRQLAGDAGRYQAERAANRGQRRAQLVRNSGDELVLHALDALALGDVPDQSCHASGATARVPQCQAGSADDALLAGRPDDTEGGE